VIVSSSEVFPSPSTSANALPLPLFLSELDTTKGPPASGLLGSCSPGEWEGCDPNFTLGECQYASITI
jgi:hypothetical protein